MKSFMKFIVTIIVIALIGYIVYYLVINNTEGLNNTSGDFISGEILSGDIIDVSGEMSQNLSGETSNINSGEENVIPSIDLKAQTIRMIDEEVNLINSGEVINVVSENLSSEFVSESARSFMSYFKLNDLPVTINVKDRCIEIIPASDFLENMVYYYDENGNLILYESVSTTIEGSTKYYFENGTSIDVVWNYEEDIEKQEEYVFDVLNRAHNIYNKFLNY